MYSKLERLGLGVILGPIAPLIGFLGMWWLAYLLLPEKWLPFGVVSGLLLGIAVDVVFLKRQINIAHQLDLRLWGAIYIFYSICVFGFFMGVPIFNLALALPASFVIGARLASKDSPSTQVKTVARQTALFTTIAMFVICLASALLALIDPHTAANLEGMFGLPFQLTRTMIVGIILAGGLTLLVLQWGLTIFTVQKTFRFMKACTKITG